MKIKRKTYKHYILSALFAVLITATGVIFSYKSRGYWAVGGEVLIVPLILLIKFLIKDMRRI